MTVNTMLTNSSLLQNGSYSFEIQKLLKRLFRWKWVYSTSIIVTAKYRERITMFSVDCVDLVWLTSYVIVYNHLLSFDYIIAFDFKKNPKNIMNTKKQIEKLGTFEVDCIEDWACNESE